MTLEMHLEPASGPDNPDWDPVIWEGITWVKFSSEVFRGSAGVVNGSKHVTFCLSMFAVSLTFCAII